MRTNIRPEALYLLQSQGYDFRRKLARLARFSDLEIDQALMASQQSARVYASPPMADYAIGPSGT